MASQITAHTNRLIHATSPYLLQHAHNPVDWYEWGEEALEKARQEDKPILVSIGYSSCHWCHVMERESFEQEDIAAIMNSYFVCIKVDREERPDIDQLYMEAVQAMQVQGGWPLNVFLTADQRPFYGGTYFPPQNWAQLLNNVHKAYGLNRDQLEASALELTHLLSRSDVERFKQKQEKTSLLHDLACLFNKLESQFDTQWGGMQKAPKFVMPATWQLLLRHHHLTGNQAVYDHILHTLRRIAMGGIHDQLGGGFSRYSVDGEWFAPHFEKMLYDNAQLMSLYAEAYRSTGEAAFKQVLHKTFTWLQREMTHEEGGFYSAIDADSEGEEGRYYVWTQRELEDALDEDAHLFIAYYGIQEDGNWEHGQNILHRPHFDADFLAEHNLTENEWSGILNRAHHILLKIRQKRIAPAIDDKITTAWNAQMITGLTDAYQATGTESYLEAAEKNIRFIEQNLSDGNQLYRGFKHKRSQTPGFLDDYALLIQAYLNLYQVTFREVYLLKAQKLTDFVISHFFDHHDGFFFYTDTSHHDLIVQKKEIFDNVIPSSNSIMARNLWLLGTLLDVPQWQGMATAMVESLSHLILSEPNYMANWGISLLEIKQPITTLAILGEDLHTLRRNWQARYYPFSLTSGTTNTSTLPLLREKHCVNDLATIFVCFGTHCLPPVHTLADAEKLVIKSMQSD